MKNTPIHICHKTMLVDLGQKGELVLSIASYPAIALENTLN
jgi:hypothetical protein